MVKSLTSQSHPHAGRSKLVSHAQWPARPWDCNLSLTNNRPRARCSASVSTLSVCSLLGLSSVSLNCNKQAQMSTTTNIQLACFARKSRANSSWPMGKAHFCLLEFGVERWPIWLLPRELARVARKSPREHLPNRPEPTAAGQSEGLARLFSLIACAMICRQRAKVSSQQPRTRTTLERDESPKGSWRVNSSVSEQQTHE